MWRVHLQCRNDPYRFHRGDCLVVTDPGRPEVLLLTTRPGAREAIDRICVEVSSEPIVLDEAERC
jgi:hypothetical protein